MLAVIPGTDDPAVMEHDTPELLALSASRTAEVTLDGVEVPDADLAAGPVDEVMKQGAGGTGSVGTSALAVGHAAGTLRGLEEEAEKRPELRATLEPLEAERATLSSDIQTVAAAASAADLPEGLTAQSVRARANSLCLRSAPVVPHRQQGGRVRRRAPGRAVRAGGDVLSSLELPRPRRRRRPAGVSPAGSDRFLPDPPHPADGIRPRWRAAGPSTSAHASSRSFATGPAADPPDPPCSSHTHTATSGAAASGSVPYPANQACDARPPPVWAVAGLPRDPQPLRPGKAEAGARRRVHRPVQPVPQRPQGVIGTSPTASPSPRGGERPGAGPNATRGVTSVPPLAIAAAIRQT